jgi:hypothetical protein
MVISLKRFTTGRLHPPIRAGSSRGSSGRKRICPCFAHLCKSLVWQDTTKQHPPYPPPTAKSYSEARLPRFDYYRDEVEPLPGSNTLAELKSVSQISQTKGDQAVPENEQVILPATQIRRLGKGRLVREMK